MQITQDTPFMKRDSYPSAGDSQWILSSIDRTILTFVFLPDIHFHFFIYQILLFQLEYFISESKLTFIPKSQLNFKMRL